MAKTASIYVRVEPELKAEAEALLEQMGLPMSNAIDMFLRQLVMHRRLPIDTHVPGNPVSVDDKSDEELEAMLMRRYRRSREGEGIEFDAFADAFRRKNGI